MSLAIETVDKNDAATVITLKGELTLGPGCTRLNQIIHSLIASGRRHLVFDLTGVLQLDSTGIGQFIDAYTTLEKTQGKMSLSGATGPVQDAFRVTRLDTVFRFVPSVEAALES
jgi:anti-sigma B factor antagonist